MSYDLPVHDSEPDMKLPFVVSAPFNKLQHAISGSTQRLHRCMTPYNGLGSAFEPYKEQDCEWPDLAAPAGACEAASPHHWLTGQIHILRRFLGRDSSYMGVGLLRAFWRGLRV